LSASSEPDLKCAFTPLDDLHLHFPGFPRIMDRVGRQAGKSRFIREETSAHPSGRRSPSERGLKRHSNLPVRPLNYCRGRERHHRRPKPHLQAPRPSPVPPTANGNSDGKRMRLWVRWRRPRRDDVLPFHPAQARLSHEMFTPDCILQPR